MANNNINRLTVVLEGDSKKLQSALKAAEESLKKYNNRVKGSQNDSNKVLGAFDKKAKALKQLGEEYKNLATAKGLDDDKTKSLLSQYKKLQSELGGVTDKLKRTSSNRKAMGAFDAQIKSLKELEKRYKNVAIAKGKDSKESIKLANDYKKLKAKIDDVNKSLKGVAGSRSGRGGLGGVLSIANKLGPALAAAFSVREIAIFGKEAVMLGAKLEGVKNAFQLIEDGGKTSLSALKTATRGAVDEMTLMSLAVQADNFKIPLENLGQFFEFATIRAAQTGESVEHLTRSIVLGIGRKSPLILDNLGITLVRLKEAMGKVGRESATVADISAAVAKVAKEEVELLKDLGLEATTAAQKMDKLSASFKNWKASIGEDVIESGFFGRITQNIGELQDQKSADRMLEDLIEGLQLTGDEIPTIVVPAPVSLEKLEEAQLDLIEELQERLSNQLALAKGSVQGLFGSIEQAPDFFKWAKDAAAGLQKMHEQGEFLTFDLKTMQRAVRALKKEEEARRNELLKGEKEIANKRTAFLDKYKQQLKEVETRFELRMISPAKRAEEQNRILSRAIVEMKMDVKGLGLEATKEYGAWGDQLKRNKTLLADINLELQNQENLTKFMNKYDQENAEFMATFDPRATLSSSDDFESYEPEEVGELDQMEGDRIRREKELNKLVLEGIYTERQANQERLKALNEYLEALSIAGEEIPAWMLSLRDQLQGTLFDKNELRDMVQMWSALSSAMSQVAGVFSGDSGIGSAIQQFAKLASVISAVVAAQVAYEAAKGDPTAAPRAIAAATAAFTGLAGLIGSVVGGFGSGGSGMGYNAGLNQSERLYTEISGRNLRVVLDREGSFSSRRG